MKVFHKIFLLLALSVNHVHAQSVAVDMLTSGTKTNLRGLSVVSDNVLWVSGSGGKVGKTSNGGKNWKWMTVKGFEKADFRDIEAFDANTAIIMAVSEPAYILKTTDGGDNWKVVYQNKTKGIFLDAMDFSTGANGTVIGDPINGKIFIATTFDGGDTWKESEKIRLAADSGEAFFAASGTNIRLDSKNNFFMVSGGTKSRLFTSDSAHHLAIIQGKETTGANSIALYENGNMFAKNKMIIVGGDFNADSLSTMNCLYSMNNGKTWKSPMVSPHGYRSCVEFISKNYAVACGLTGVDITYNAGRTWRLVSTEAYNTCIGSPLTGLLFFAGPNGKVGRLVLRRRAN